MFGLGRKKTDVECLLERLGSIPKGLEAQMDLHEEILALQGQLAALEETLRLRIGGRLASYGVQPIAVPNGNANTTPIPKAAPVVSLSAPRVEPNEGPQTRVVPKVEPKVSAAPVMARVASPKEDWWGAIEEASKVHMSPAFILKGMLEQAGVPWERGTMTVGAHPVEDIELLMEDNMTAYHNGERVAIDMQWTFTLSGKSDFVSNMKWVGNNLRWLGQGVAASSKGPWDYSPYLRVSSPKGKANVVIISVSLEGGFEEKEI